MQHSNTAWTERSHSSEYLRVLPDRHVGALASREELLSSLRVPLAQEGEAATDVLDLLAAHAPRGTTACASPRYFGFVVGGSHPVALATDWLVSTWDQNAGIYVISPLAAVAEEVAAEWLLELLDLPRGSGVGFVTGCQMANFTCLAAARHAMLRRAGWDVEANVTRPKSLKAKMAAPVVDLGFRWGSRTAPSWASGWRSWRPVT